MQEMERYALLCFFVSCCSYSLAFNTFLLRRLVRGILALGSAMFLRKKNCACRFKCVAFSWYGYTLVTAASPRLLYLLFVFYEQVYLLQEFAANYLLYLESFKQFRFMLESRQPSLAEQKARWMFAEFCHSHSPLALPLPSTLMSRCTTAASGEELAPDYVDLLRSVKQQCLQALQAPCRRFLSLQSKSNPILLSPRNRDRILSPTSHAQRMRRLNSAHRDEDSTSTDGRPPARPSNLQPQPLQTAIVASPAAASAKASVLELSGSSSSGGGGAAASASSALSQLPAVVPTLNDRPAGGSPSSHVAAAESPLPGSSTTLSPKIRRPPSLKTWSGSLSKFLLFACYLYA